MQSAACGLFSFVASSTQASITRKNLNFWRSCWIVVPCWISCFASTKNLAVHASPLLAFSALQYPSSSVHVSSTHRHYSSCFSFQPPSPTPLQFATGIRRFPTTTMAPRATKISLEEKQDDDASPTKKTTTRKRVTKSPAAAKEDPPKKKSKKRSAKKKTEEPTDSDSSDASPVPKTTNKKKGTAAATKKSKKEAAAPKKTATKGGSPAAASKPKKPPAHQVLTERDEIPKLWPVASTDSSSYTFKIASWNVAGLRAVLKKSPEAFSELMAKHDLDVLCLQETKLQEQHLDDPKLKIKELMDLDNHYDGYWTCSTAKKGYAGTAMFIRKHGGKKGAKQPTLDNFFGAAKESSDDAKTNSAAATAAAAELLVPQNVSYKMGKEQHDAEGRIIMVDFPLFSLCNVYTPNSGQKLERLTYRTDEWDKDFLAYMQQKQQERGLPVLWLGDLNVAHTNLEVWNDGAKHLPKQAGVTPQERASFQEQLNAGFVDAFRHLHPTAAGHYSYWSTRAGNRAPNKGLRLDYFICDPSLFDESSQVVVRDSYMDFDQDGSDHCPVILEMEIKPTSPSAN